MSAEFSSGHMFHLYSGCQQLRAACGACPALLTHQWVECGVVFVALGQARSAGAWCEGAWMSHGIWRAFLSGCMPLLPGAVSAVQLRFWTCLDSV